MLVTAYLISAPPAWQEISAYSIPIRILHGLRVTDEGDEEHLTRFSKILLGRKKGEQGHRAPPLAFRIMDTVNCHLGTDETYNALFKSLPFGF
jgi:hypothetical protein